MALLTTHKLFIDAVTGNAYRGWNDFSSIGTPVFYAGDTEQLELYLVRQTTSAAFPMESVAFPASNITAAVGTPGGTPAASGTSWSSISGSTATFSAPTLTIPVDAIGGSFTLSITDTGVGPGLTAITPSLPHNVGTADISSAIKTAVNAQSGWSDAVVEITQTGAGKFIISATAVHTATVYELTIAVGTSVLSFPSGYKGSLAMTGAGVTTLLGSNTSVASTFEVQCNTGSGYQTYLQIPCTVRAQVTNP